MEEIEEQRKSGWESERIKEERRKGNLSFIEKTQKKRERKRKRWFINSLRCIQQLLFFLPFSPPKISLEKVIPTIVIVVILLFLSSSLFCWCWCWYGLLLLFLFLFPLQLQLLFLHLFISFAVTLCRLGEGGGDWEEGKVCCRLRCYFKWSLIVYCFVTRRRRKWGMIGGRTGLIWRVTPFVLQFSAAVIFRCLLFVLTTHHHCWSTFFFHFIFLS